MDLLRCYDFFHYNTERAGVNPNFISNFTFNNLWTFREKIIVGGKIIFKFLQFNLTSLGAVLLQSLVVFIGNSLYGRGLIIDNLFFFLGLILVVIWNFFFYSKVIWKVK